MRAVVLLSGGLDSATLLRLVGSSGYTVYALSVDYGQRHREELGCAVRLAHEAGVADHVTLSLDLARFGGSALTSAAIPVPKNGLATGIPVTYVPARNTVLLSLALGWAEALGARDLFIGVNAVDYSGYPDCRPAFIESFQRLANLATRAGVEGGEFRVHAPLLAMSKAEIIRTGLRLGVDYGLTRSCYDLDAEGRGCGICDACRLRLAGFAENGMRDPAPYRGGGG
ncbi:MAG: 7-cyano-7-deazaguanine synthase QueC [Magnetococcales bacterium]|nr:7-cyano-7-deazaguanine synthase QueC [Magnetococcales bacterium]